MKKNYSIEERQIVEKLINEKLTYREIAKAIGRSPASIKAFIRNNGGRQYYTASFSLEKLEESKKRMGRHFGQLLTTEQKILIDKMVSDGRSIIEIMSATKRGYYQIRRYIREECNSCAIPLHQRMEALEQQFEILFETLTQKGII